LVTRLAGIEHRSEYVPPMGHSAPYGHRNQFGGFYADNYASLQQPGYMVNDKVVTLETNLYNTKSSELVWALNSETFNPSQINEVIDEITTLVIDSLVENGLL